MTTRCVLPEQEEVWELQGGGMVVLCKSRAGYGLFVYLPCLFVYYQNWGMSKTVPKNFKTIIHGANWRWFLYCSSSSEWKEGATAAGHLRPEGVRKCWDLPRPPAAAPTQVEQLPLRWSSTCALASCIRRGVRGIDSSNRAATLDDTTSSGGGGFPRALPLGKHPRVPWNHFLHS